MCVACCLAFQMSSQDSPVTLFCACTADDDPFGGISTPQHQHTASASSAVTSSGAAPQPSPSGDDPFSLWGEPPPPQPQPQAARQPRSGNSAVADDLLEQFTAGASAQPQQAASHGADDALLDGFVTSGPGVHAHCLALQGPAS